MPWPCRNRVRNKGERCWRHGGRTHAAGELRVALGKLTRAQELAADQVLHSQFGAYRRLDKAISDFRAALVATQGDPLRDQDGRS